MPEIEDDYYSSYNRRTPVLRESNKRLPVLIFDQVKADLDARNAKGFSIHSRVLDDTVEKDWLIEMYEELLDACVYCRAMIAKREREMEGQR